MMSKKPQILTKTIVKSDKGFGFNLIRNNDGRFFIRDVSLPSCQLQENDIILRINHIPISQKSHKEVVSMCKEFSIGKKVLFTIQRDISYDESIGHSPVANVNRDGKIQTVFPDKLITLKKGSNGFGFRIAKTKNKFIIGKLDPNGAAQMDGNIETNDELVTINGTYVQPFVHTELVDIMAQASHTGQVTLGIRKHSKRNSLSTASGKIGRLLKNLKFFFSQEKIFIIVLYLRICGI